MPVVDGLPGAVLGRQVPPGTSRPGPMQHPIDHHAMVRPRPPVQSVARQQRRQSGPLLVGQIVTNHPIVSHVQHQNSDRSQRFAGHALARWIRRGVLPTANVLDVAGLNDPELDLVSLPPAESLLRATFCEVLAPARKTTSRAVPSRSSRTSVRMDVPIVDGVPKSPPRKTHATAAERTSGRKSALPPAPADDSPSTRTSGIRPNSYVPPVRDPGLTSAPPTDGVLPRFMTDTEKTAIRQAWEELADRGEAVTAPAVQSLAARSVPSVALRTTKSIGNYLRAQ